VENKSISSPAAGCKQERIYQGAACVPEVGQVAVFDPFVYIQGYGVAGIRKPVEGTVVMVNPKHRMFTVEYGDPLARTSFNFFDIGREVQLYAGKKQKKNK